MHRNCRIDQGYPRACICSTALLRRFAVRFGKPVNLKSHYWESWLRMTWQRCCGQIALPLWKTAEQALLAHGVPKRFPPWQPRQRRRRERTRRPRCLIWIQLWIGRPTIHIFDIPRVPPSLPGAPYCPIRICALLAQRINESLIKAPSKQHGMAMPTANATISSL